MITPRYGYMATLLLDGRVLVVGGETIRPRDSAELYEPVSEMWTATGSMITPRYGYVATLLPDGKVLVAGGNNDTGELASAELYDPISGTWTSTGPMTTGRRGHTLTLLPDGKVLVAGGIGLNGLVTSAELYDPISGTCTATGVMATGRIYHTATLLPDGKVLVAAGHQDAGTTSHGSATAELYDPITGTWGATGVMVTPHSEHTATLLPDGKVLVAGGASDTGRVSSELYDPISGAWRATGALVTPRATHTATLLPEGMVLVAGGGASAQTSDGEFELLASAELYDPASGTWSATANMVAVRQDQTATLLPDGRVLVAGGLGLGVGGSVVLASAEVYDPGSGN
jgi:WD40 repeat protein